jgi:MFS family permease
LALTQADKTKLFWASFLALTAAGVGFVFRAMIPTIWEGHFQITKEDVGKLTGAALWPIAVTMVLFSLLLDRVGYRFSMFCAFALQTASVILTLTASTVTEMWWACFFAGLGHGIVEAVINPLCASIYRSEKSKMLNILHASWPAGLALGGTCYMLMIGSPEEGTVEAGWDKVQWIFLVMLVPVVAYGVLFSMCHRYPIDERVEGAGRLSGVIVFAVPVI